MRNRLEGKAHLIVLGVGLLNMAVMPLWRLAVARSVTQAVGYPLFGLGLALNLLSLLALRQGVSGKVDPVTELVTGGIYARLRHPMYVSFAILVLALDVLSRSALAVLFTTVAFVPSMIWRARLEERALARRFGKAWEDYAQSVPSLLVWDLGKARK
jgi:protein-S-isoprenylcysteine O-methyltransferase Ste14